eukprot:Gregarina_sp_Poly_1__4577@NODE_2453_length_2119_cov_253_382554_g1555_i0_p2_GENE_NODE_2453_length_2119_cov_253_382554_g1555_i0NODE_2453_length_2119_cov_253_382554_g1555_i0_p2_ORF_typecomplete_len273_score20_00_NODE_2453_length_2119_cov_253_382554_g1555_i012232041
MLRSFVLPLCLGILTYAFPIGLSHPLSFACDVKYQNSNLTENPEECAIACKQACGVAGIGKRLKECLRYLQHKGHGDCIYSFRQTVRVGARLVCTRPVPAEDGNLTGTEVVLELADVSGPRIIPRTAQPKALGVTINVTSDLCPSGELSAFALQWASAISTGVFPATCKDIQIIDSDPVEILEEEVQYVDGPTLSLDILAWGFRNWRALGFEKTFLVLRSYPSVCTLNTSEIIASTAGISQFGTVKVAQASVDSRLSTLLALTLLICTFATI